MGVVAILVMLTIPFHLSISPGGSKWDLVTIGPVACKEMFDTVIL